MSPLTTVWAVMLVGCLVFWVVVIDLLARTL